MKTKPTKPDENEQNEQVNKLKACETENWNVKKPPGIEEKWQKANSHLREREKTENRRRERA